ncbi:MAG: hypothetical protein ABL951_00755 [Alphaproteobacteria bacterium]
MKAPLLQACPAPSSWSGALMGGVMLLISGPVAAQDPDATIITLTQTGCQFLESEAGADYGYKTRKKSDCIDINEKTGKERLRKIAPLTVKPGKYIFRVSNKNVPYELGFWLRGTGLGRLIQPNVSGGGLTKGVTRDYSVELTAGNYAYSCPLNPTPDYPLIVKE